MASLRLAMKLSLESAKPKETPELQQTQPRGAKRSAAEVDATTSMNLRALSQIVVDEVAAAVGDASERRHVNKWAKAQVPSKEKGEAASGAKTNTAAKKNQTSGSACQVGCERNRPRTLRTEQLLAIDTRRDARNLTWQP